jgi:hypothetical protein
MSHTSARNGRAKRSKVRQEYSLEAPFRKSVERRTIVSISELKAISNMEENGDTKGLTWDP